MSKCIVCILSDSYINVKSLVSSLLCYTIKRRLKIKKKKVKMQSKNKKFDKNNDAKKRAYLFGLEIIYFIRSLPKDIATQIIARQLIRSATSLRANIIEAQASSSRKDFKNFLNHALKSANETKFWLCLIKDSVKSKKEKTIKLLDEANQLSNILGKSIITLKR